MTRRRRPGFIVPRLWPSVLGTVELERLGQAQWRARLREGHWAWTTVYRRPIDALLAVANVTGRSGAAMYPGGLFVVP